MKALLIAKNWPEPNSTAAGRRTLNLLKLFKGMGFDIHVACAAEKTPFQMPLEALGYSAAAIIVNDSRFDDYLEQLKPGLVIFDRFVMEEQFGWRVRAITPDAMTVLDTSDLHCLRLAREQAIKHATEVDLFNEHAVREVTSILRCDLTIMISQVEMNLLTSQFNVPEKLLYCLPFLVSESDYRPGLPFDERKNLVMFGGFKHSPNRDAVHWLKQELWPAIRKQLPSETEIHIYGGYADHAINQLHNPKAKFLIKGRADCALTTIGEYRLNLAPLRFGAGQKGKILDGWLTGTATLTTPIGAESMATETELGYRPTVEPEAFASLAAKLYLEENEWRDQQARGYALLRQHYTHDQHAANFIERINAICEGLRAHRHQNLFGRILWQNQFKASEYMSRWIELKNR